ncbi:allergen Tha p 1-like [Danaus plexippus]|uniref:Chemosensory protein n=1 Tax=Danaus plexippus plexippus TaxID=278856 RepID=A0A212FKT6_DANPL|nr:allergen Tha p 1-like [Danaus plexippus]OWR54358.1 chemosensory protein [Danaus plexippus plexippus]
MDLFPISVLLVACFTAINTQTYEKRYDSVNIDDVLSNKRLLAAYVKCVLDQGRCTPEGKELKSHIADALQSGCDKCTETQKDGVRKVIKHLIKNERDYWKQLVEKFDPEGVYAEKYEDEIRDV